MPRFRAVMNAAVGPLLLLLWMVVPSALFAQAAPLGTAPLLSVHGLRGGREVGSAAETAAIPRLRVGLGYAYTEGVLDGSDRHQRAVGEVAAAYPVRPYLQVAALFEGRLDAHRSDLAGRDGGGAFATTLLTRHAIALPRSTHVAAQLKAQFPAAESPSRGFRAVTPSLTLLASHVLGDRYELSANVGYRFDRTRESIADPWRLSAADRLAAALSDYDAALLGALFAQRFGRVTASLEWSWDVPVGGGAPRAIEGAMRVRAAAQMLLADRYLPGFELGVSPSARPAPELLARVEPRVFVGASVAILFARATPPPKPAEAPRVEVRATRESTHATLRVVDPTGAPVTGARVKLEDGTSSLERLTDEQGVAELALPAAGAELTVEAAGFETHRASVSTAPDAWTIALTPDLPEGEIKGKVRSLRGGKALRAHVVVQPLGTAVDTDAEGNFRLTVPPGSYTLAISAVGYEAQERPAQVERLGVTILVVDLRRSSP